MLLPREGKEGVYAVRDCRGIVQLEEELGRDCRQLEV